MSGQTRRTNFEAALLEQNRGWLMAYVHSQVGNPHTAEEIVQEVFLTGLRESAKYDGTHPLGAWLRGIARNLVHAHWRREGKSPVIMDSNAVDRLESVCMDSEGHWMNLDAQERRASALRACMGKMAERARLLLNLKFDKNLRTKEIARRLQLNVAAVDMAVSRAKKVLFDCVKKTVARYVHE